MILSKIAKRAFDLIPLLLGGSSVSFEGSQRLFLLEWAALFGLGISHWNYYRIIPAANSERGQLVKRFLGSFAKLPLLISPSASSIFDRILEPMLGRNARELLERRDKVD